MKEIVFSLKYAVYSTRLWDFQLTTLYI